MIVNVTERVIHWTEKVIMFIMDSLQLEYNPKIKLYGVFSSAEDKISKVVAFTKLTDKEDYKLMATVLANQFQIDIMFTKEDIERFNQIINIG